MLKLSSRESFIILALKIFAALEKRDNNDEKAGKSSDDRHGFMDLEGTREITTTKSIYFFFNSHFFFIE